MKDFIEKRLFINQFLLNEHKNAENCVGVTIFRVYGKFERTLLTGTIYLSNSYLAIYLC